MKTKRFSAISSALVLGLASFLSIIFPQIAHAAAPYTCTWTGAGGNSNFSTAANWSGCNSAAPVASDGDNLVFDNTNLTSAQTLNNDITGLTVGTVTFQGTGTTYSFSITGDAITINTGIDDNASTVNTLNLDITLGGNVTVTDSSTGSGLLIGTNGSSDTLNTNGNTLTFTGGLSGTCKVDNVYSSLSGSGSVTDGLSVPLNFQSATSNYTGAVNVSSGEMSVAGGFDTTGGITVDSGSELALYLNGQNASYNFPLTLNGGTLATTDEQVPGVCGGGGNPISANATLSNSLTLTANSYYDGGTQTNTTLTGTYTPGLYTLTAASGSNGTLTLPGGSQVTAAAQTINYDSNSPSTQITVTQNQTAIVDGTYGSTTVDSGGTIEGNGTVGGLFINGGGILSPGQNCMTVNGGGGLSIGGTYDVVLGGTTPCSGYTQVVVTGSGSTVDFGTATTGTLNITLSKGFTPKSGDTFVIIDNKAGQAINQTFNNLPEGSDITVSGYIFKITYKGGTTNNVELTYVGVPKTPDTGLGLSSFNAELPIIGSILVAGGFFLISKKLKNTSK